MAKFKCSHCGTIVTEDQRKWPARRHRGKTKYKSYCTLTDKSIYMMKVGK